MVSLSGNSGYPHDVLTVLLCLLTVSQAYVNVALNKPAYQQYQYQPGDDSHNASNAVDGRKSDLSDRGGQCAISHWRQTATWWVNLITIHSIHHITIYFRTDSDGVPWGPYNSFLGFSVYVSNTTDRLQGTLCYKDDNFTRDTIPAVFTTTCPVHGQYVIYYNERLPGVTYPDGYSDSVANDLCEVEVYGCPATGYFGSNCSVPCSDVNCQYCHIETGTCQGCKPGYKGHRCEMVCEGGTYGAGCKVACGNCRDVNQCSINNGTCLTGCDVGFKGDLCKTACDRGSYGYDCNEICGHCRDVNRCSMIGTCLTGCDAGYQGDLCKTSCDRGSYGYDCNEICGHCRDVNRCSMIGTCLTGCDAGYQGDLCKTSCDSGSYGYDCKETCGHCRDVNKCSIINGTCLTGCVADYQGNLCKTLCPVGYFGQDCSETCINSYTCDGCNDVSGSCDYGCRPGWIGYFCQKSIFFSNTFSFNFEM
ncbi:multiple epidermal growth factor-like domains protein 11 [Crassostrea angulata]|uniref:multiple epidermal growth factor-like domains protein 11 n=1 Tax=Magallana angulata TaxID=2784310 RepID=UPI0022B136C0|nr:multiple epidermal growth factor-like domains protein 11 [Crassostrea angulata]